MTSPRSDRKRRREAIERRQALEARRRQIEAAVLVEVRAGLTQPAIAAKCGIGEHAVGLIIRRLQAEGVVQAYTRPVRKPDEVWHEVDDARARAALAAHGVRYPSVPSETRDDLVAALRNGAAARAPVFGGSVAGACADAGLPVA